MTTQKKAEKYKGKKTGVDPDKIKLKELFEVYKAWRGQPAVWRGMSPKKLSELGIEDPIMTELLSIKNQSQFGKKYNVGLDTLTQWNKTILNDKREGFDYLEEARKQMAKFTKNVVAAHYKKVTRRFDAMSGELWYQIVNGWNEKKLVEHSGKLSILDLAKQVADEDHTTKSQSHTEDQEKS